MSLLIRGGRVVDPAQDLDAPKDLLIEDSTVTAVEPRGPLPQTGAG